MPQSVDPLTTRVHVPPRIPLASIDANLLAPVLAAYRQGPSDALPNCHCTLKLKVPIEEDDTSVELEARWFIDYDVNNPPSTGVQRPTLLPGSLDNTTSRGPAEFEVQPDSFATNGTHVIEMVVAERTAFINSSTRPNRAVDTANGYQSAVYRFVVDVQPSPQPSCPDVPPAPRICSP